MKVPCKGCQKRTVNCHASCSLYKKYVDEMQKIKKCMSLENQADAYIALRRNDKLAVIYKKIQKGLRVK